MIPHCFCPPPRNRCYPTSQVSPKPTKSAMGVVRVHSAAADGDVEALKEIAAKDRSQLFKADHNGWRPLHEAARSGRIAALAYLIEEGT
jgi:ankyrin repeat protein